MHRFRVAVVLAMSGCGPVVDPADGSSGVAGEDGAQSAGEIGGSEVGGSEVGGGDDPIGPRCNDGHVDYGELCDDGNAIVGDGCNPDCRISGVKQWEDELYRDAVGEHVEADAVVIWPEPAAIVVGGTLRGDSTRTAELLAYGFEHTRLWQLDDAMSGVDASVAGLVGAPNSVAALVEDRLSPGTNLSLQWAGPDGSVQLITPLGIHGSVALAVAAASDDTLVVAGDDMLAKVPSFWLTSVDSTGVTRWLQIVQRQPVAIARVPSGGFDIAYAIDATGTTVERRDADGALVFSAITSCAGPMDVDAGDTTTIVQATPDGLGVCRIGPDGSTSEDPPIDVGPVAPVALAVTPAGDLLVGGGISDGGRAWVGRISRAGVLQWSDLPWFGNGLVRAVDIDDERGVAVAVGTSVEQDGHGFIAVYSP